jgi:hypothetical protein
MLILLLILLTCGLNMRPVYAVDYLHILSAEPNGSGATVISQIELVFDRAVDLDTVSGSINTVAIQPSQVSADGSGTVITIAPGALIFGQSYNVIIDHTVSTPAPDPVSLVSDYLFSFTVTGTQPPPLPSSFHGEIHFSDNPPGIGDTVEIYAPGILSPVATAVIELSGSDLVYQVNVPGDIAETSAKEGGIENDLLTFIINGRIAATATWHTGSSVLLDFHPPAVNAGGPYAALVNTARSLNGSVTDWLVTDSAVYAWNMNGNATCDNLSLQAPSCTFTSMGTKTIGLEVTDGQGGEGSDTASVIVIALEGLTGQTYDGTPKSVTVIGVEPPLTYTVTYDGSLTPPTEVGSYTVVVTLSNGATVTATMIIGTPPPLLPSSFHGEIHFYDDPPFSGDTVQVFAPGVSGTVATATILTVDSYLGFEMNVPGDIAGTPTKEGGVENDPLTFMIDGRIVAIAYWHTGTSVLLNLHPPQAIPAVTSGNEGTPIDFSGASLDWGDDIATYALDVDNNGTYETSGSTYTWADNGSHTIGMKVTDAQGGEGTTTFTVTVNNVAPTATFSAPDVDEGSDIQLSLSSPYDPSTVDTAAGFLYAFDCGDGTGYGSWSANNTANCPTNDKGTRSVKAKIQDKDGGITEYTVTVTIHDVLPADVDAGGPYTGTSGQAIDLTGSATCLAVDACTYAWDLDGDGVYDDATGATPSYTWFATGDFTIRLQVTDNDGNTVTSDPVSVHINPGVCTIPLVVGWNLVSCNIHPVSTKPVDVFAPIYGNYDLVYAWDATGGHPDDGNWLKFAPDTPSYSNNLKNLDEKMGFWIEVTEECTLEISGSATATTDISLWDNVGGWNLVGYPSITDRSLLTPPGDHAGLTDFTLIYAYHANDTSDPWKLFDPTASNYANDLKAMTPGWGYWINVTADSTWAVNYLAP